MLNIEQEIIEGLSFNLDQAVAAHQEALENHRFTVDIPAPTADPLVEAVVRAGGYAVIPRPEEPENISLPEVDDPRQLAQELRLLAQRADEIADKLDLLNKGLDAQ